MATGTNSTDPEAQPGLLQLCARVTLSLEPCDGVQGRLLQGSELLLCSVGFSEVLQVVLSSSHPGPSFGAVTTLLEVAGIQGHCCQGPSPC